MPGRHERKNRNREERERLKGLRTEELETLVPELHREITELTKPLSTLKARYRIITEELRIRKVQRQGFVISDHAVVRYLQRTGRVDIDAVRDEIVQIAKTALGKGNRRRHEQSGLVVAIDPVTQVVATILNDKEIVELEVEDDKVDSTGAVPKQR